MLYMTARALYARRAARHWLAMALRAGYVLMRSVVEAQLARTRGRRDVQTLRDRMRTRLKFYGPVTGRAVRGGLAGVMTGLAVLRAGQPKFAVLLVGRMAGRALNRSMPRVLEVLRLRDRNVTACTLLRGYPELVRAVTCSAVRETAC